MKQHDVKTPVVKAVGDMNRWARLYDRFFLGHARIAVVLLVGLFVILGFGIRNFRIDASADALVLEHDSDLRFYREMSERYPGDDYLLMVYSPVADLFAPESLAALRALRDDLRRLPSVSSVVTILDVPLLRNPPVPIKDLKENIKTLDSANVDVALARREFSESPLFRDMLVSADLRTTAIQILPRRNEPLNAALKRRTVLRELADDGKLDAAGQFELARVTTTYSELTEAADRQRTQDIQALRDVMAAHRGAGRLFLGGVPMIANDMIAFIKKDLMVFGAGMFLFLVGTLGIIFKRLRWVLLPTFCCVFSVVAMMGGLGWFGWNVTVISANFISLQLIMTMALAIHLIVRYRELQMARPDETHRTLILATVTSMFTPCLYTTLTTMVGFSSLIFCDILPVINFGWMMTMGLAVSMLVTFLLLPTLLALMSKPTPPRSGPQGGSMTALLARFTDRHPRIIYGASALLVVGIVVGIVRLQVENSFINYFRPKTEIYQGMTIVDQELGGTTPLDVMLDLSDEAPAVAAGVSSLAAPADEFSGFEEFDTVERGGKYWYTPHRLDRIKAVHEYLEGLPAVGKVVSLHTMVQVAGQLRGSDRWEGFELALLFGELPEAYRRVAVEPYASTEHDQARLSLRIKDSDKALRRDALLKRIRSDIARDLGIPADKFRLSGMMVLYNNMLQSLYRSQVQTIGFTILGILGMFVVLFRSVKVSLIAMIPNLVASFVVFGVMGLSNIPLDMMTITIVAISMGIAVDNTIHYIHRFEHEVAVDGDYRAAMFRCHGTIGKALYYTTVTIVVGFSILVFSEFIPSCLFGLLIGLAVSMALLAALTLLPLLILFFKPFGPGKAGQSQG